jgi:hypothetical protein
MQRAPFSFANRTLAIAKHRAQRNQQKLVKVMLRSIAVARILQPVLEPVIKLAR